MRGLDESCGARLKLKMSRKTGEKVSREMCVCMCRGVCVYTVCVCYVCMCCVCMCVNAFSLLETGPGNSSIPAAVSTPGARSWFLYTISFWRSQTDIPGDWDGVTSGPGKVRWARNIWCQKIRQCLKMKRLSLAKYKMRLFLAVLVLLCNPQALRSCMQPFSSCSG